MLLKTLYESGIVQIQLDKLLHQHPHEDLPHITIAAKVGDKIMRYHVYQDLLGDFRYMTSIAMNEGIRRTVTMAEFRSR
jgi:hypothetical protein